MCGVIMLKLQLNTRSLIADFQDFKQFVASRREQPEVLCIQVTSDSDLVLYDYVAVRLNQVYISLNMIEHKLWLITVCFLL